MVRRVNDDNTYDLEYVNDYKWLGVQRGVDPAIVQKRGEGERKKRGEGIWHWDGMSESEEEDWREGNVSDTDGNNADGVEEEDADKKQRISFQHFDDLDILLDATDGNEELCIGAIQRLSQQSQVPCYSEVTELAAAIKLVAGFKLANSINFNSSSDLGPPLVPAQNSITTAAQNNDYKNTIAAKESAEDMILLNLLYAPRRSRLHSILKVLARIETAGHICAWTKASKLLVMFVIIIF